MEMVFLGFNIYAWVTILTVVSIFTLLLFDKVPADIAFVGGMGVLLVTGVLTPSEALGGFSSSTVVVVGVIYVVLAGLVHTGVLQWMVRYLLGVPGSYPAAIVRLMLPVALLSSVLTNTTVVALFINVVKIWAKKLGVTPSKLLIPLSYASGMGGICTLIGTAPNLIISGFYTQQTGIGLSIFTPTLVGLGCLAVGMLSMVALRKLLPERTSPESSFERSHEYTVELLVPTDCPQIGDTVEEAGLTQVNGGHLIEIVRFDKEVISPVAPDEFIFGGDRLVFAGNVNEILELRQSHGLVSASHHVFSVKELSNHRKLHTATLPQGSSLVGRTLAETQLEEQQNCVLVAVARQGERIASSPRDIQLKAGDTLLLEGEKLRPENFRGKLHFFQSEEIVQTDHRTVIAGLVMIAMIVLPALKVLPLLSACFLAAFAMLICRCCSPEQAQRHINWSVLMVFAGSICLGTAIEKTGIASRITDLLLSACGSEPLVVMAVICLLGTFITEFISNTAAAAMFCPIAFESAQSMGVNPLPFCVALMIAVSSSFATPIGSPTHMLVYGPGGYRFGDFMRVGLPMNLIIWGTIILLVPMLFPF